MGETQQSKDINKQGTGRIPMQGWVLAVSILLVVLWGFPQFWYTRVDADTKPYWYSAKREVAGYSFVEQPITEAVESILVADETFNGEYRDATDQSVIAFMAKRHEESVNEVGLFVHTPDRCWTEGGWKMVPIQPDYVEVEMHGERIGFERRLFVAGPRHELVYFTGMVGGQTLPYRLDHNLSVALKYQLAKERSQLAGTSHRMVDNILWERVWDSFTSRRQLLGPKQFIRVSTQVFPEQMEQGDARLKAFLDDWLERIDYEQELENWKRSESQAQTSKS